MYVYCTYAREAPVENQPAQPADPSSPAVPRSFEDVMALFELMNIRIGLTVDRRNGNHFVYMSRVVGAHGQGLKWRAESTDLPVIHGGDNFPVRPVHPGMLAPIGSPDFWWERVDELTRQPMIPIDQTNYGTHHARRGPRINSMPRRKAPGEMPDWLV